MLFGIAFQDLGGFHHPHCFAKRMALAVAVLLPLKMQLLSCHHLYVFQHLGLLLVPPVGGTMALASNIRGSSTSCIALARVTTAMWNISCSASLCLVRSSPSLLSSKSTVDRSSSHALLFGFSNSRNSVSALRFCDPGM
jgi:hypothetical protein